MADIYLTKKERNTLYTEGLIYTIVIAIASYLTIYGGLFIKMFPMMFVLGIVGRCIFDKPKTTVFLGTIAFLFIGFVAEYKLDLNLILSTLYSSIMICLGLVVGKYLRTLYFSYKLRVFLGYNKRAVIIFSLILLTVLVIFFNSIINSNPIQYIIAKKKTDTYINKTYETNNYNIESVNYSAKNKGGYTFNVNINNEKITLVHKTPSTIEDMELNKRKEVFSKKGNEVLFNWKETEKINEDLVIDAIYSYSKVGLEPDILYINISAGTGGKGIAFRDEKILLIIEAINKLQTFDQYNKITGINIIIDDRIVSIPKKQIVQGITKEYIEKGLNVEYLG